jgi:hypothetical protein
VSEKPLSISPVGERTEAFPRESLDGVWYTLDGRKLAGKPSAPGIYVKDGRKVAIKREKRELARTSEREPVRAKLKVVVK